MVSRGAAQLPLDQLTRLVLNGAASEAAEMRRLIATERETMARGLSGKRKEQALEARGSECWGLQICKENLGPLTN